MSYPIERRVIQRAGNCRGCDFTLLKGEEIVSTYSHTNGGQNIRICLDCAKIIGDVANE